jgi:PAS domain S-box-containing protein
MRSDLQRRLAAVTGAVLALLAAAVWVHWRNTVQADETADRVTHTRAVLGALEHALRLNVDLENGLRGFVITSDETFLDPLVKAREELPAAMARLRALTRDNPVQQERVVALEKMVIDHVEYRTRTAELVRAVGYESARQQLPPGDGKRRLDEIRAASAVIRTTEEELLHEREAASDAATRRAEITLAVLALLAAGTVLGGYVGLRRAFAARSVAEEALRGSEENLAITLDSIGDAVLATDVHGIVMQMNPVAQRLTGWPIDEARGRPVGDVFHIINGQTRAPAKVPIDEVLASGKIQGLANDTVVIARDGTECAIADSAAPIRRADGSVAGVVMVFRDVSEERRAELAILQLNASLDERVRQRTAELRASEQRLRATLDDLIEGVQIIGFDWRYHYINAAAATQGRSTVDALVGRTMMEAYPGIERTPLFATLQRCMDERSTEQLENDFVYPDGSSGTFQLVVQPVPEGIFILSMDISARKQAERLRATAQEELERRVVERTEALHLATEELEAKNVQLEQASRLKSEFLANMSHELRTPLNAIIGFSEILRSGLAGDLTPRQREFTGDIHSSGTHLLSLISDILDLAKIEAGSMTLDREVVDVVPLIESCLAIVRDKATARTIELRKEVDPSLGAIDADPRKLRQIVFNLLSNAVKFTDPGGRVSLAVRRIDRARIDAAGVGPGRVLLAPSVGDRAFIEISVQDNGIGIAEVDLTRLFQPFVQVDASMKRRHEGTGLGLALVRRLVDLHGGGLAVESAPGRGSRFMIWLPYRPALRAARAEDATQAERS